MKVTKKNISLINDKLRLLEEKFAIPSEDSLVNVGDEMVCVSFLNESDFIEYEVEDFLKYVEDIDSLDYDIDNGWVRTSKFAQYIVDIDIFKCDMLPYCIYKTNDYIVTIQGDPFLVGVVSCKEGLSDEDVGIYSCSDYNVVEFEYLNDIRLTEKEEIDIVLRFIYSISSTYNVSIKRNSFHFFDYDDIEAPEESDFVVTKLLSYTKAMDYFTSAMDVDDDEIKFLYFYKVMEFYSPVVSKKVAIEKLNQKLDALVFQKRDYQYLNSIFELSKKYENSQRDSELCTTILKECLDVSVLFPLLPESIKTTLCKKYNIKNDNLNTLKSALIEPFCEDLGEYLYATRNGLVHAKSNYKVTGKECPLSELYELNDFMRDLCKCLISWNDRQPLEFKV